MSLMDSLGIDKVEADPNALPDNKWIGEIVRSQYVHVKKNDSVAHVITYKVTEGDRAGAERAEFWTIGTGPKFAEDGKTIIGITAPTMSDAQKPWYKKRFVDLGIPEAQVSQAHPNDLVGKKVVFGTKKNGGYININFVELRTDSGTSGVTASASANPEATLDAPAPAPVASGNVEDLL